MKYYKLTFSTKHSEVEILTTKLLALGIDYTEVEDRADLDYIIDNKDTVRWDYIKDELLSDKGEVVNVSVYFDGDEESAEKIKALQAELSEYESSSELLDDQAWINSYKDHFHALDLTSEILVLPSWDEESEAGEKKVLRLDPGMAFGTGTHETTSMCARFLDDVGCKGKKVLDVGTGSGILAIAAALMGAKETLGVDIDPVAVEIAKENVALNNCEDRVEIREGDLMKGVDFSADVVLANLMAEIVCELTQSISKHMNPGSAYISSGILIEKQEMVKDAIRAAGLTLEEVREDGEWCAILASKK